MDSDDKRLLLAEHLAEFRGWTYDSLVAEIDRTRASHDCLRHAEGVFDDGTEYQMEFNVFWDGDRGGDVRVTAELSTAPPRRLLHVVPIYMPDVTDSFIMSPDGTFIGESE